MSGPDTVKVSGPPPVCSVFIVPLDDRQTLRCALHGEIREIPAAPVPLAEVVRVADAHIESFRSAPVVAEVLGWDLVVGGDRGAVLVCPTCRRAGEMLTPAGKSVMCQTCEGSGTVHRPYALPTVSNARVFDATKTDEYK